MDAEGEDKLDWRIGEHGCGLIGRQKCHTPDKITMLSWYWKL